MFGVATVVETLNSKIALNLKHKEKVLAQLVSKEVLNDEKAVLALDRSGSFRDELAFYENLILGQRILNLKA